MSTGVKLGKAQARPLALPPKGGSKAPSKAPSPTDSAPATPAAGSPPAGTAQVNSVADAVRQLADDGVQALLKDTSPSGSGQDSDARGAAGTLPTLQSVVAFALASEHAGTSSRPSTSTRGSVRPDPARA